MTTIAEKADHVRGAHQSRLHECHWPGCHKQVPPAMWGCRQHWYRLPLGLRTKIWQAYRIGQEETLTPSRDYVAAAREVRAWIAANTDAELDAEIARMTALFRIGNGIRK